MADTKQQFYQSIVQCDVAFVRQWCTEHDGSINEQDSHGRTALHLAVISSTLPVVECLLEHGAKIDQKLENGETFLHLATIRGDMAIFMALAENYESKRLFSIDILCQKYQLSPLHLAILTGMCAFSGTCCKKIYLKLLSANWCKAMLRS
jgi:hypothetical protein